MLTLAAAALAATAIVSGTLAATASGWQLPGRPAPELARLFTPLSAPDGTYDVTVLGEGIEEAIDRVRRALPVDFRMGTPPGAWKAERFDPLDAFGEAGIYDRAKVAQLYLGRKVSVARGPIERDRRVVAALTLFSPYPDPTLSRLEPGTLAILLRTGQ